MNWGKILEREIKGNEVACAKQVFFLVRLFKLVVHVKSPLSQRSPTWLELI